MKQYALLTTLLLLGGAAAPRDNVRYYAIVADGGRIIGHASHEERWGGDGPESVDRSQVELQELDQPPLRMTSEAIVRRDRAGQVVWLREYTQTGTGWARTEARIADGRAEIAHRTRTGRWATGIPLPTDVRFDGGHGLLRGWDRQARLEFRDFNLGAMAVDRVVIEAAPGAAPDAQGRIAVLRKRYEGSSLRAVARLLLDRDNRVVELTQPSFGTSITIRPTDRATALRARSPYSMLRNAQLTSPYQIQGNALQGHIRYRFGFRDGLAFDLPQTGEQRVTVAAGTAPGSITVDICAACGPGHADDEAERARALRPTRWLQSGHPRIRAIAATYARMNGSERRSNGSTAPISHSSSATATRDRSNRPTSWPACSNGRA